MSKKYSQNSRSSSPWTLSYRLRMLLWEYCWPLLCSWTPKHFYLWRLFVLRCFGAVIFGRPFVHQRARIEHPWNLTLHSNSTIGDRSHLYCLGHIEVYSGACVAQEVYVCTATHDLSDPSMSLLTSPITICSGAFIGARAFILPGIIIGEGAIVGACSVVTKNVPPGSTVVGNPARILNSFSQS